MYSVPMAIADFMPVFLFGAAAVILQRDFYNRMSKGVFALFSAGTVDVFLAGFLKALYKLLYAAGICDLEPLTQMFFPVQAIGFLLAGIAVIRMIFSSGDVKVLSLAAVPVYKGTMIFVIMMVLGLGMMEYGLIHIAYRKEQKKAVILFVLSFVFCLAMGYLSSRDFTVSWMNWIAETVNILGQGCLFLGVNMIHKAGIAGI